MSSSSSSKGTVVITGASSGIGKSCAQLFSSNGYATLLLARRAEAMPELENSLRIKCDVTNFSEFEAAIERGEKELGDIVALVNNAGVMLLSNMADQGVDEWQTMLDVNVKGVLHGVKIVLSKFVERKSGTIVNISSIAGHKLFDNHTVYCATKFAVGAISEGVRQECAAANVRCSVVSPGVVETELLSHTTDAAVKSGYEDWKTTIEVLQPSDVADAVYFVVSRPQYCCIREIVLAPTKQVP
jgi:NADP-dependent 3-hydroxy acid dehydrogenase YdfG